jgi:hypothetical protein
VQATFRKGTEELTLLLRHEIATGEFLIVSIFPDGKEQAERFGNQEQAVAYFKFMEDRLRAQQWRYANAPEPAKAPTPTLRPPLPPSPPPIPLAREEPPRSIPAVEARDIDEDSATYVLGRPLSCPHCHEWIREIHIVRLTREHVPFTSTLPRSGRALVCPSCEGLLSAELSRFN